MSMKKQGDISKIISVLDPKEEEAKSFSEGEGRTKKISKEAFKKGEPEIVVASTKS